MAGEAAQAYRGYRVYRDLGPRRSLAEAWRVYRRIPPTQKSRGRPRTTCGEARRPSGQWTAWSSEWKWRERAADYDAQRDAQQHRKRLQKIQQLEERRLTLELSAQDRFEKLVWEAEALLDKMDELPPGSSSESTRQFDGKTVTASEKRIEGINLAGYARLVRMANEAARNAVVGVRGMADKQMRTHNDQPAGTRPIASTANPDHSNGGMGRLPGEPTRAFRAFRAYRDQGPDRSLAGAWTEEHPNSDAATRDCKHGRRLRRCGHWAAWSSQWNWRARAATYDTVIASAEHHAQCRRRENFERTSLDFEFRNQDRVEARIEKISAVFQKVRDVPVLDVSTHVIVRDGTGRKTLETKSHVIGLDCGGFVALSKQYQETLYQAVNGVREGPHRNRRR